MDLKLVSTLLVTSFTLALNGCHHALSHELTFSPHSGDEHRYMMYTSSSISGIGKQLSTQALIDYQVNRADHHQIGMGITFDFYRLNSYGMNLYSNRYPRNKDEQSIHRLISSGLDVSFNSQTGDIESLRGQDQKHWQQAVTARDNTLTQILQRSLTMPGVAASIPTKTGAIVPLDHFIGIAAQLVVTRVTETELSARLETITSTASAANTNHTAPLQKDGNGHPVKIYGYVTFDRQTTWIKSMVLQASKPFKRGDEERTLNERIVMLPPEDAYAIIDSEAYASASSFFLKRPFDFKLQTLAKIPTVPHAGSAIPYNNGFVDAQPNDRGHGYLQYHYFNAHNDYTDAVRLTHIQPVDHMGKPINTQQWFINQAPAGDRLYSNLGNITYDAVPLGWAAAANRPKIAGYTATAEYSPAQLTPTTFDWNSTRPQTIKVGEITVSITPQGNNTYHLHAENAGNSTFLKRFDGLDGEYGISTPLWLENKRPNWVSKDTDMAIVLANPRVIDLTLQLEKTPEKVTLYSSSIADKPTLQKSIKLTALKAYSADPDNPPAYPSMYLSRDDDYADADKVSTFNVETLHPTLVYGQGLEFKLPQTWALFCQLKVDKGFKDAGHPVEWQKESTDWLSSKQMLTYNLSTDVGRHHFFYGKTVATSVHCNGTPQWETIDVQTDKQHPWLVDIDSIAPNIDRSMPFTEFQQRYRFKIAPHILVPAADALDGHKIHDDVTLAEELIDGRWLRLFAYPQSAEKLTTNGPAIDRHWTHTFKPLP